MEAGGHGITAAEALGVIFPAPTPPVLPWKIGTTELRACDAERSTFTSGCTRVGGHESKLEASWWTKAVLELSPLSNYQPGITSLANDEKKKPHQGYYLQVQKNQFWNASILAIAKPESQPW